MAQLEEYVRGERHFNGERLAPQTANRGEVEKPTAAAVKRVGRPRNVVHR